MNFQEEARIDEFDISEDKDERNIEDDIEDDIDESPAVIPSIIYATPPINDDLYTENKVRKESTYWWKLFLKSDRP